MKCLNKLQQMPDLKTAQCYSLVNYHFRNATWVEEVQVNKDKNTLNVVRLDQTGGEPYSEASMFSPQIQVFDDEASLAKYIKFRQGNTKPVFNVLHRGRQIQVFATALPPTMQACLINNAITQPDIIVAQTEDGFVSYDNYGSKPKAIDIDKVVA
ncbi:hypothetical protein LRP52_24020 [Photobacterium sp. ZSDE20]|uniref:Uncharacterized protein n=1 Tax=Photobacterium pectinilyticum TaxID=2906793 RepID=A0ABT1N0Z8_9GAMM|nr:hypothetical protein [Photobacterium sp. ZSDE20]MCQ1058375.1 hypothetical protein [Photobacterium sp. ZSDE20]MDD1825262.1 hypothetical protein [Photobacterium sp. ZSDE20]